MTRDDIAELYNCKSHNLQCDHCNNAKVWEEVDDFGDRYTYYCCEKLNDNAIEVDIFKKS